jgi:conserved hypothetical protein
MSQTNQSDKKMDAKDVFNPNIIKKGAVAFIIISLLSLCGLLIYSTSSETTIKWSNIRFSYLLFGLLFIIMDLYLGGLRNHIFIREFVPGTKLWISITANLANIFMGAVTPSQSGGGPAQWYILYRAGVSIPDNISNSFFNWISTLIYFPISGMFALYILQDRIPEGFVLHLTRFGFSVFTTLLIVVTASLYSPALLGHIVRFIGKFIGLIVPSLEQKIYGVSQRLTHQMKDYRSKYLGILRTNPHLMIFSFILTMMLYLNKYALAYVIALAFNIEIDFWAIVAVMSVLYLLLYFAPSPGGAGIAEVSLVSLLAPFMGADLASSITLVHRSFLIYIPAIIGSIITIRQVSKEAKSTGTTPK